MEHKTEFNYIAKTRKGDAIDVICKIVYNPENKEQQFIIDTKATFNNCSVGCELKKSRSLTNNRPCISVDPEDIERLLGVKVFSGKKTMIQLNRDFETDLVDLNETLNFLNSNLDSELAKEIINSYTSEDNIINDVIIEEEEEVPEIIPEEVVVETAVEDKTIEEEVVEEEVKQNKSERVSEVPEDLKSFINNEAILDSWIAEKLYGNKDKRSQIANKKAGRRSWQKSEIEKLRIIRQELLDSI